WIDGELPPDEAARVEAHAKSCAACGALVGEARGLVAASSRIVSALDVTPGGDLPAFGRRPATQRWTVARMAIAATLVLAAGTLITVRGRVENTAPLPATKSPVAAMPVARPDTVPSPAPSAVEPLSSAASRMADRLTKRAPVSR